MHGTHHHLPTTVSSQQKLQKLRALRRNSHTQAPGNGPQADVHSAFHVSLAECTLSPGRGEHRHLLGVLLLLKCVDTTMSHFCLDQSANAFWKPQILHTSYLSRRPSLEALAPAPQAGSSWEAGFRADARRAGLTSSSPGPMGPHAGLNRNPAAPRPLRPAPTAGDAGARERSMEEPA